MDWGTNRHRAWLLSGLLFGAVASIGCNKTSAAAQTTVAPVSLNWDENKSHLFDLELTTVATLGGAPSPMPLVLRSQLEVGFRRVGGSQRALLKLVDPRLVDRAGNTSADTEAFQAELAKPFAIELSNGLIAAYFEPGAQTQIAGFRRHIAAALQLSEHAPGNAWKGHEWDSTGLSDVQYSSVAGGSNVWDWKKTGYTQLVISEKRGTQAVDTSKIAPKVVNATGRLTTDAAGIVEFDRREQLSVRLSPTTTLDTDLDFRLKRTGFGAAFAPIEWQELEAHTQRAPVGSPALAPDDTLTDQARIGSHSFPEVVDKLTELEAKPGGSLPQAGEAGPLFNALVGIFRLQPERIADAERLIRKGSPLKETLLDALASASNAPALDVLGKLALDRSLPDALRARAAGSLIRAQQPTAGALEIAVKMIDDPLLRENGLFGLGSFVRQLREHGDRTLADAGTQVLARQLSAAKAPSDLSSVLLAISNSGSAELFDAVSAYQKDPNASVRHAAIQAIRLMPQDAAEARLREVLDRPDRGDVIAALHALGRRVTSTRESVDRIEIMAKKDPSADVRREAVLVLGAWSRVWPALVPVLADIREHDSDPRVRDVAKPIGAH